MQTERYVWIKVLDKVRTAAETLSQISMDRQKGMSGLRFLISTNSGRDIVINLYGQTERYVWIKVLDKVRTAAETLSQISMDRQKGMSGLRFLISTNSGRDIVINLYGQTERYVWIKVLDKVRTAAETLSQISMDRQKGMSGLRFLIKYEQRLRHCHKSLWTDRKVCLD